MPVITADRLIEGRTPEELWDLVKDSAQVADRTRHVVAVRARSAQDMAFRINEWRVLLNGSEVTWTQREAAGPGFRLRFDQTDGDLESLSGQWTVAPAPDGTRVSLTVSFGLGIDGLSPLLEPIWSQSFQAHTDELLRAVADLAA